MGDPLILRLWAGRAMFFGFVFIVVFLKLLPLSSTPSAFPGPDLLVALTLAWVIRRPQQVPILSVAIVFFLSDMIFLKPPGLWTLIMLGATEFLRSNTSPSRDMPLLAELGIVTVILIASIACEQLILTIFMLPHPGLGVSLVQIVMTLIAYPVVVVGLQYGLGLRHVTPDELYATGRRL